jgi:hypothetical protein
MRRQPAFVILAVQLALFLAACAGPETPSSAEPTASPSAAGGQDADGTLRLADGSAGGPGITIEEAIAQAGSEPLLVNGALFIDAAGSARLCSAIAESFPPQCGGTRLLVSGLDPAAIPDLQEANGVRWAEQVQLFGTVTAPGS